MFDSLKKFFSELTDSPQERSFEANDYRLAAVALLVHIATIDGHVDDAERAHLQSLVETRFGLTGAQARDLIVHASESEREAVDLFRFTSVLKRLLDEPQRRQIVEMLWEMAYADGKAHEFEENAIWRISELLGVSTRERVNLRQQVRDDPATPEAPEPKR